MSKAKPKRRRADRFTALTHGWSDEFLPKLKGSELPVYLALAPHAGPASHGLVWANQKRLAGLSGVTRRATLIDALQGLAERGLIDIITWPIFTDIGASGYRELGGGKESGRGNVYFMRHVDNDGMHRQHLARPGVKELMESRRTSYDVMCRAMLSYEQDMPGNVTRKILLDVYPEQADWFPEGPEEGWARFMGLDIIHSSIRGPSYELDNRFPGIKVLWTELAMNHPDSLKFEEVGRLASGRIDRELIRDAVAPDALIIVDESEQLSDHFGNERRFGLDNLELWKSVSPTLAGHCERLQVGPRMIGRTAIFILEKSPARVSAERTPPVRIAYTPCPLSVHPV